MIRRRNRDEDDDYSGEKPPKGYVPPKMPPNLPLYEPPDDKDRDGER